MFYFQQKNNIPLYKSSLLDDEKLKHAFTSRIGGQTPFPLSAFSMGTADNPELLPYIEDNRKKICELLGIKYENLVIPEQKHTDNIKIISSPDEDVKNCDGLITETPELVFMLLFADCVPVIIYAPDKHVVSVVHAGWRGTAKSIVKKSVNILEKNFNVDKKKLKAVIGPAIGKCCYPVSSEVAEQLLSTVEKKGSNSLFTKNNVNDNNLVNINLKKLNVLQLRENGVIDIDMSDNCTSCMSSVFYSYRADKAKTGRHAAIVSLL